MRPQTTTIMLISKIGNMDKAMKIISEFNFYVAFYFGLIQ